MDKIENSEKKYECEKCRKRVPRQECVFTFYRDMDKKLYGCKYCEFNISLREGKACIDGENISSILTKKYLSRMPKGKLVNLARKMGVNIEEEGAGDKMLIGEHECKNNGQIIGYRQKGEIICEDCVL